MTRERRSPHTLHVPSGRLSFGCAMRNVLSLLDDFEPKILGLFLAKPYPEVNVRGGVVRGWIGNLDAKLAERRPFLGRRFVDPLHRLLLEVVDVHGLPAPRMALNQGMGLPRSIAGEAHGLLPLAHLAGVGG